MSTIDNLLRGCIDMHMHAGPDPRVERRLDALQAASQAQEAGMRAIVLKSHEYPTAPLASIVNQVVPDVTTIGSISLDFEVGGLNPCAVEASAKMGAKVVWMPTFSSANDMSKQGRSGEGISILDEKGKLLPVVHEILAIVKQYRMVLATGHVSVEESFALVETACKAGLLKIVVTHPLMEKLGAYLNLEQQQQMAAKGAFIEHCFVNTMPLEGLHPEKIVESVRTVGAEHCILSTDLGQAHNPAPAEGMRMAIATMLLCHLTEREIELMIKVNPASLLDLD
jgi:hypothetical protein